MFDRNNRRPPRGPTPYGLEVLGLPPEVPEEAAAVFRGRLIRGVRELFDETGLAELELTVRRDDVAPYRTRTRAPGHDSELDLESRMSYFVPVVPAYDFSRLVLPTATLEELHLAVDTIRLRDLVFGDWGLREIEPHPRTAIGLHGPPGTGKTMVAHAIARHLGRPILPARTSQLESKYHGEGGKYLAALFEAARQADAVLFVDEAESLLSRRFESVSQGSEHAVNTLRAELVQHLDAFEGVAVFATNLVTAYDPAISSRLHHVRIPEPDFAARKAIWSAHLPARLPLAADVSVDRLAEIPGLVGRDIKRIVINATVAAARRGRTEVRHEDLATALARLLEQRPVTDEGPAEDGQMSEEEKEPIARQVRARIGPASPTNRHGPPRE
jgi:SpoVK/Ycf46/Vps4 family AAA+-type ATPase